MYIVISFLAVREPPNGLRFSRWQPDRPNLETAQRLPIGCKRLLCRLTICGDFLCQPIPER